MLIALLLQAATLPPPSQGAAIVPPGAAQPPATMVVEPAAMAIAAWDADGDGRTTRAELAAGVKRSFDAIDTAHAGSIGYIGFADWAARWLGDRNALPSPFEVDANADNRITLAELQASFAAIFDRHDRDKDGAVTRQETLTIRAMGSEGRGAPRGRKPPR